MIYWCLEKKRRVAVGTRENIARCLAKTPIQKVNVFKRNGGQEIKWSEKIRINSLTHLGNIWAK